MNILIYNFDEYTIDDLETFSEKMNSSIFFAISHQDVKELLKNRNIQKVIYSISEKEDFILLIKIIKEYEEINFYILYPDNDFDIDIINKASNNNEYEHKHFKWIKEKVKLNDLADMFG